MRLLVVLLLLPFLATCITSSKTEISTRIFEQAQNISNVCVKNVNFYADKDFTQPASPHWYMDTSRNELIDMVRDRLPKHGFYLVECTSVEKEIHTEVDLYIYGSILGVYLKLRARVYYKEQLLFEIYGNAQSPPNRDKILETQRKLADELVEKFAQNMKGK